jgi:acetyl-CoA carboxylase carboxyl transferase subunit alpha
MFELGLIDEVVPEPMGGAHQNQEAAVKSLRTALVRQLDELVAVPEAAMLESRYQKFRKIGEVVEGK